MTGSCLRSSSNGEEPAKATVNLSPQQFKHGDDVWSRIDGESWWPAQVVDETFVTCKPKKIKNEQILVRLYGTFEHMYMEPVNCVSKIEKIFGQENSSNREVFQKFLEEDLTRMKSGGQSAATISELKEIEKVKDKAPRRKSQRKGNLKRTMIADNTPLAAKASKVGVTKRRTRSETFKARNEGANCIEVSDEAGNVSSGVSTILNVLDISSESDCDKNPDVNENTQIEFSDAKDIKKLVTKIVKEVAEKTKIEALKSEEMERCPENFIDASMKISCEMKNKGNEVHITEGDIDAVKPSGSSDNEGTKDGAEMLSAAEQANDEIQGTNGGEKSQSKSAKRAKNGGKVVKGAAFREKKDDHSPTTECVMRPRRTRVMQSLGLIAPLGSPF